MKDKLKKVWDAALKNSKYVFPVIVCAAVAITVVIALRAGGVRNEELNQIGETLVSTDTTQQTSSSEANEDAPLVKNENAEIHNLIASYYSALAYGDEATLNSVCDNVEEMEMLWFLETSKYVEYYPELEIYTKPGFGEGETIAYVCFKVKLTGKDAEYPGCTEHYICTQEDGSLYIKRTAMTAEQEEYKNKVGSMADVLELSNRVKVEFDNLMEEQPELLAYMDDVSEEVRRMVGEELSSKKGDPDAGQQTNPDGDGTENGNGGEGNEGGEGNGIDPNTNIEPNVTEVIYAVASTTVNVRKSDSQKAEKIGRLTGGTKVQVLEEMVNGWTKIQFEKQEGYVMSQYLKVQESALKYTPIGKVKATDNINVRADASTDSSKIGTLVKGDEVDLLAVEGEWCKINYKNQTAYVKSEFVEKVE
ncbi:MAG: SH3 domain-containing protein [Acetatifactor sp.]|nr:SH3 domain-containing protein [Acetatifactor sp.]